MGKWKSNRRQFMAGTLAAAGSVAAPRVSRAAGANGKIRMGFIGVGNRGSQLLHLFMRRAGQVLSQADIMDDLYELDRERELNTVEVLVGRLRRKIGRGRITTLRGMGYRFER